MTLRSLPLLALALAGCANANLAPPIARRPPPRLASLHAAPPPAPAPAPEQIPELPTEETVNVIGDRGRTLTKCLGVLVAPRIVVTASHCVQRGPMSVDRALLSNDRPVAVTRVHWDPRAGRDGRVDLSTTDVAILELAKPIVLASYPLVAAQPARDGTRAMSTARTKNGLVAMEIRVRANGPGYYRAPPFAEPGDSGGPVYTGAGAHRRVIAVTSGGSDRGEVLARVDVVSDLVERTIRETEPVTAP